MHADVTKVRAEIHRVCAELRTLKSGAVTVPQEIALRRVDQVTAHYAEVAEPWLRGLIGELTSSGGDDFANLLECSNHRALQMQLVALLPDLIGEALKSKVRTHYAASGETGTDPATLPARIRKLEADLLALEIKDVALSEKHGEPLRPETDPRALLGVA
jgi:hypothetical protein